MPSLVIWEQGEKHVAQQRKVSAFGVAREEGGVQLVEVPEGSPAAAAGLESNDLILAVNDTKTPGTAELFAALLAAGEAPLRLQVVRHQKAAKLSIEPVSFLVAESAGNQGLKIKPAASSSAKVTASQPTGNDPLTVLTDGKLAQGYGPVFSNGTSSGAYLLDLGAVKPIMAVSSWSFYQNGNRGRQLVTLFGSAASSNPGWNTRDRSRFIPLGTIDTASLAPGSYQAASLRARPGGVLGEYLASTRFPFMPLHVLHI